MSDRRRWCAALAKLVSPSFPADATAALCDMLPALQHMPDALFSETSLVHVASIRTRQSVPSFAELTAALTEFRRTYVVEDRLRLTGRPNADLPEGRKAPADDERTHVRHAVQGLLDELAARRGPDGQDERPKANHLTGDALRRSREARGCNVPVERV